MSKDIQIKNNDLKPQTECEKIDCSSSKFSERFAKKLEELTDFKFVINIALSVVSASFILAFDKFYEFSSNPSKDFSAILFFIIFAFIALVLIFGLCAIVPSIVYAIKSRSHNKSPIMIIGEHIFTLFFMFILLFFMIKCGYSAVEHIAQFLKSGGSQ